MPSISVPLKGSPGWTTLMKQRKAFWATPGNAQISDHFVVQEFYCHDGSAVPTVARPALVRLCKDYLEPMRTKFGLATVLSGYRHEQYNASIGGARHSQHIYEMTFDAVAADMRFQRGSVEEWVAEAKRLRAKAGGGGVGRYPRSGFVHVDNRSYNADWSG